MTPSFLSFVQNRRPIEEINGSRSLSELISVLGFGDLGEENNGSVGTGLTELGFRDIYPDLLTWESPAVVSTDYVLALSDFGSKFQALRVLICGSAQATVVLEKKYKTVGYL
ncbi:hypothetical protein MANES_05G067300v8 [Manihot esculenta]|uniref:Uncharacterized protein n=4 Tax=Manihot esculenta TaxID=3983 RepID=A0ACB7HPD1_MANES|nr:hypothetical protein MANES_05G067300v8 [Manihot esculenta]KAG8653789.1 hypothetical protein MANES_05G067300v8 [Manihot esculenta]KAG8653790.1 hypothetical protein MANES_05G067300v8 [Manihot esculenta]KAG8653791.1 hypothetical protein MANES_05G067300v8 [Manihot esculenta]